MRERVRHAADALPVHDSEGRTGMRVKNVRAARRRKR